MPLFVILPTTILVVMLGAVQASGQQPAVVAFRNVNVIPMTGVPILRAQTVVVTDSVITAIGPIAKVRIPQNARIVDGNGTRFLLPGFADMHVHTFHRDELQLFLAHGITTIRNLHGTRTHLAWRDSISQRLLTGPRIFTSGPIIDGDPPNRPTNRVITTAAAADSIVRAHKAAGYDEIKIYDNVSPVVYEALVTATRRERMRLVGHLPTPVGLDMVLRLRGQSVIEHSEEILPFLN